MKSATFLALASFAVGAAVASAAPELGIIPIYASGGTHNWLPLESMFGTQPTWDAINQTPVSAGTDTSGSVGFYGGRYGFVDFGPDYAGIQIYQTWTRYREWSGGNVDMWAGGAWISEHPDQMASWPGWLPYPGTIGDVGFELESSTNLPETGANEPWVLDSNLSTPVTPAQRYLLLKMKDTAAVGTNYGRGEEYAFVGVVPEPASLGLLGVAGLMLVRRRCQ